MKKIIIFLFISAIFQSCSFDNKTGIWKDSSKELAEKVIDIGELKENKNYKKKTETISQEEYNKDCKWGFANPPKCKKRISDEEDDFIVFEDSEFKKACKWGWFNPPKCKNRNASLRLSNTKLKDPFPTMSSSIKQEDVAAKKNVEINNLFKNNMWLETNFSRGNNIENVHYRNENQLIFKSSKLTKSIKRYSKFDYNSPLVFDGNIVSFDHRGTVFIYSIDKKKKLLEYNFYKKRFKKYKKEIFLIIKDNVLYAADNLGYIYAINIESNNLLWAKNFGIPFRSNLKILDESLFLANQDNIIYSVNIKTGKKNWQFATNNSFLNSEFKNNIIIDNNYNLLFLNTSGELYSINAQNRNINWLMNFTRSASNEKKNIFESVPLVSNQKNVIVTTDKLLASFDLVIESKLWEKFITTKIKPTISKENVFVLTKKDYLLCLDNSTGDIIWSKSLRKQITSKNKKLNMNKIGEILNLSLADNSILLFSSQGYILFFDYKSGSLKNIVKIKRSTINSDPVFSDGYIYFFNQKGKLIKYG